MTAGLILSEDGKRQRFKRFYERKELAELGPGIDKFKHTIGNNPFYGGVVVFEEVGWSLRRCGGLVVSVPASSSPVLCSDLGPWPPYSVF